MMPRGISAQDAAENLKRAFASKAGTCTVAEFEADPERYLNEWVGGTMQLYQMGHLSARWAL